MNAHPLTAAAVVVALAAVGCSDDPSDPAMSPPSQAELVECVCAAGDAAAEGRSDEARRIFFDRAHDRLHELAADTEADDRAAAARLLEAMQRVEADLAGATRDLADDLDTLATATIDAIAASGDPLPEGCPA